MMQAVDVKFKEIGKTVLCGTNGVKINQGDYVIVDFDRSQEYGHVISPPKDVEKSELGEGQKGIVRVATKQDMAKLRENKIKSREALEACAKKVAERKLPM